MATRKHHSIGEVLALLQDDFPDITISKIRFLESQGLISPERTPSGYRRFFQHDLERLRWILTQQRDHYLPLKVIREKLIAGEADAEAADAAPADVTAEATTAIDAADIGAVASGVVDVDDARSAAADAAPDVRTLEGDATDPATAGGTDAAEPVPAPGATEAPARAGQGEEPQGPGAVAGDAAPEQIELLEASEAVGASEPGEPAGAAALAADPGTERPSTPVEPTTALEAEREPDDVPADAADGNGSGAGDGSEFPGPTDGGDSDGLELGTDEALEAGASLDDGGLTSDTEPDTTAAVAAGTASDADPDAPGGDGPGERDAAPLVGQDDPEFAAAVDGAAASDAPDAAVPAEAEADDPDRAPVAAGSAASRGRSRSRRAKAANAVNGEAATGAIPEGGEAPASSDRAGTEAPSPDDGGADPTGPGEPTEPGPTPGPTAPEPVVALTRDELAEASGCPVPVLNDLERFGLLHGKTVGRGVLYDADALVIAQLAARFANHGLEPRHLRSFRLAAERELGLFAQVVGPLLQRRDAMAHERAMETLTELTGLAAELHQVLVQNLLAREYGGR